MHFIFAYMVVQVLDRNDIPRIGSGRGASSKDTNQDMLFDAEFAGVETE
jgi:hypothetical protein